MKLRYALLAGALLTAAPADAATYLISYKGTVSNGFDYTGVFGTPGSLDGLAYTAKYTLTLPTQGAHTYDDGTRASISGGLAYGAPPPVSGTLTINGISLSLVGAFESYAHQANEYFNSDEVAHFVRDANGNNEFSLYNRVFSPVNELVSTQNYTAMLHYDVRAGDNSNGFFNFDKSSQFGSPLRASGGLTARSVSIAAAAVPEPATWAMMIGGFGMIGAAERYRRRSANVSFATA